MDLGNGLWWLPRTGDPTHGVYMPIPAGGVYFVTDLTKLLPKGHGYGGYYYNWALDPDLPQQFVITGLSLAFGSTTAQPVDITVYKDTLGIGYKTGTPPGAEIGSNFWKDVCLVNQEYDGKAGGSTFDRIILPTPILIDRTAGDHLVYSTAHNDQLYWCSCMLSWVPYTAGPPTMAIAADAVETWQPTPYDDSKIPDGHVYGRRKPTFRGYNPKVRK